MIGLMIIELLPYIIWVLLGLGIICGFIDIDL